MSGQSYTPMSIENAMAERRSKEAKEKEIKDYRDDNRKFHEAIRRDMQAARQRERRRDCWSIAGVVIAFIALMVAIISILR